MAKKKDDPLDNLGKLNHSFIAGNFRANVSVLDVCRWCLRPMRNNTRGAACAQCDMVEV